MCGGSKPQKNLNMPLMSCESGSICVSVRVDALDLMSIMYED